MYKKRGALSQEAKNDQEGFLVMPAASEVV